MDTIVFGLSAKSNFYLYFDSTLLFFVLYLFAVCIIQAFAVIANSPLRIDLSCVLEQVFSDLTAFLRKVSYTRQMVFFFNLNILRLVYLILFLLLTG